MPTVTEPVYDIRTGAQTGTITVEVLTDAQALAATQEAAAVDANESTLRQQATDALADLRAFRDLASPTNAQTLAAVKLLCRVCIGLIRLLLHKLDSTN